MRIAAVLFILALIAILFAALWAKSRPAERPWLPMLITGLLALGLASCAAVKASLGPALYGEDVGDPGRP